MTEEVVRYELRGHVALATIDRPEARNAISPEVAAGIEAALDRIEGDDEVWVGILTGTPPSFSAGADLKAIGAGRGAELATERGGFAGIVKRERAKPLIAAVDGFALAGGTEIVLACDLVVASRVSTFGLPEVKRGLIAAAGGLFRLPRKLPTNVAMEAVLTGDPIGAERAHELGFVNELCDQGAAVEAAFALAERIRVNAPVAVRESRAVVVESAGLDESGAWERTAAAAARAAATEDVKEGVLAFTEKRAPRWQGR